MSITIERGIPMPHPAKQVGKKRRYPFGEMEVGDSFSVDLAGESYDHGGDKAQQRIMCAAAAWKRKNGRDFSTQIDRAAGVVRCWRIT